MSYQGEPYVQPRVAYGRKRNVDQLDRREAKRAGIGEFERKTGDVVYDAAVHPVAFVVGTASAPKKVRP